MKGIMVTGEFPCVRAGKITEAMDIPHSVVCRKYPPQLEEVYTSITALQSATADELVDAVMREDGDIIHVHNEPNWPVVKLKEAGESRPIIFDVHDVTSARPDSPTDPYERFSYEAADAFVFVGEQQRDFCISQGFAVEGKPYVCLANYASHSTEVEKPVMGHVGGIVYAGGLDPRGATGAWRDLSAIADALPGAFHVYPGNPGIDYGIVQPTILEYRLLTHYLARHDWGFSGTPQPIEAWTHSFPNKFAEYMMAGIPLVALNNPVLKPFCDEGLGIYLDDIGQLPNVARTDPKPYAKRVREQRYRFTMRYNIEPLNDLYQTLGGKS